MYQYHVRSNLSSFELKYMYQFHVRSNLSTFH
jgi:hypothetical protein